jgi:NADH-quinone oxidoreductase subunit G
MTETAKLADVVFPAASLYEKDGTVTNTSGEIQRFLRALDPKGPRADFDLLRFMSHALAKAGLGKPFALRSPEAAFEEIRKNVSGYDVPLAALLTGGAAQVVPHAALDGYQVPAGAISPAHDTMFTSGSMTPYLTLINSLEEARRTS